MNPLCQVYPSLALYECCLSIQAETNFSFYDALILSAAGQGGVMCCIQRIYKIVR